MYLWGVLSHTICSELIKERRLLILLLIKIWLKILLIVVDILVFSLIVLQIFLLISENIWDLSYFKSILIFNECFGHLLRIYICLRTADKVVVLPDWWYTFDVFYWLPWRENSLFFFLRNFRFIPSETSLAGSSDPLFFSTISPRDINKGKYCVWLRTFHRRRSTAFEGVFAEYAPLILSLRKIKLIGVLNLNRCSLINLTTAWQCSTKRSNLLLWYSLTALLVLISLIITKVCLILILAHFLQIQPFCATFFSLHRNILNENVRGG